MSCIFCKIVNKEVSADIVYEDKDILAFKDIEPKTPVHLLIIPKKHIPAVDHIESQDKDLIGQLLLTAKKIARDQGVAQTGYRLIFNVGRDAGQTVDHLHLHLMGGEKLPWS